MKNFFSKKWLFDFTDSLSELVSNGISLQKSLEIQEKSFKKDSVLNETAHFLHKSLSEGTKLSLALKMSPYICFPEWYCAFVLVAEECGNLSEVLCYLKKMIQKKRKNHEKILSALIYPVILLFLTAFAGFFSFFYFIPSFAAIFENSSEIQNDAIKTMLLADIFIVFAFILIFLSVKKVLSENPCVSIFRTMAFLCGCAVPTLSALSCAFAFSESDKKIAYTLVSARTRLLNGETLSSCFGSCFERAGFKKEGRLLSENLLLDEATGKNSGFEKTAILIEEKNARKEKIVLESLQPILLATAAVYIALILKTAFLPYLTNFGGLV